MVSTIDTPMFILGTFALLFYFQGFTEKWPWLYLGGICLGLASLSKVSAIFLGFGLLAYIFMSKDRSTYLRNPHIWFSLSLAALIYSPFLYWNYQHDFPFVATARNLLSRKADFSDTIGFWVAQMFLFVPPLFLFMVHYSYRSLRNYRCTDKEDVFFWSIIPIPLRHICYL